MVLLKGIISPMDVHEKIMGSDKKKQEEADFDSFLRQILEDEKQLMMNRTLTTACPWCEAAIEFGQKCNCLELKARQDKLHKKYKRTMKILTEGSAESGIR